MATWCHKTSQSENDFIDNSNNKNTVRFTTSPSKRMLYGKRDYLHYQVSNFDTDAIIYVISICVQNYKKRCITLGKMVL